MIKIQTYIKGHNSVTNVRKMMPNIPNLCLHTCQCKSTGGCYNELVVAIFHTGGGVKGKKSMPVDFMIYL